MNTPYPGYNVLDKWDSPSFDDTTRAVLIRRLEAVPPRRFFTENEWAILEKVCECLIPQPERRDKIPMVPWLDDMLFENRGEGFRHDNMPPMQQAWRLGISALDAEAKRRHGHSITELDTAARDAVLAAIQRDDVDPALWNGVPAQRFFIDILLKTVAGIYYAHPAAWSEIGFGGPASPRGYVRLGFDAPDPWDGREQK